MSESPQSSSPVHLPDPTPWPMVLALGITLLTAGLVVGPRLALGPVKLPVLTLVGVIIFVVALFRLIREDIILYRRSEGG